MPTISVQTTPSYPILIERGLLPKTGETLLPLHPPCRAALLSDDTVFSLYGRAVMDSLEGAGYRPVRISLPAGETGKTWAVLGDLLERLAEEGLSRGDLLVVLGGGSACDVGGLAAALYHRGMDVAYLATTLLAGVDAAIGGKKEGEGPLAAYFDFLGKDAKLSQKTFEKAESKLQELALDTAKRKLGVSYEDIDVLFAGDLLNQCISSSFAARGTSIPFLGLYGACSTMAESLLLAAAFVDAGFARTAAALTSSHFASAERQYRFPLGYGGQRTPTAQWTVTGSGCCIVGGSGSGVRIEAATIGRVQDLGIKDANNMGAAMAPAAIDTLQAHFRDLRRVPQDYDLIVTGDLGALGKKIVLDQFQRVGVDLTPVYDDCGVLIYDPKRQDVHAGGSGCGCGASVLCGYLLDRLEKRELRRLLFCATGALLSPTSSWQGESIPGICHAVAITAEGR